MFAMRVSLASAAAATAAKEPLVSIVMPCYRGERFLAEAIESCLTQSYQNIELIIVDDASPDGCLAIAQRYAERDARVQVVRREENGGVARAFNSGFEVARGEFFTRLAQDDRWHAQGIARLVERLQQAAPEVGLVYGDGEFIDELSRHVSWRSVPEPADVVRYRNQLGQSVMWTRKAWEAVGPFDSECDAAEDYDFWLRIARQFRFEKVPGTPMVAVRLHEARGSILYSEKQADSTFRAVRRAYASCPLLSCRRRDRQVALACARMTAVWVALDAGRRGRAVRHWLLSFVHWPFPLPRHLYPESWCRARVGLSLCRKMWSGTTGN